MSSFQLVILIVAIALVFDFSNGWHDAANSIATVVSTRVLSPGRAVLWASFWNFIAAFVFGTAVAKTIGIGMVHLEAVNEQVLIAGLLGAILWNLVTLALGLPTSSSHALMGGYGGAAIARAGFGAIIISGWIKPVIFIVVAPFLGMFTAIIVTIVTSWAVRASTLPQRWIAGFAVSNLFPRRAIALAMAPMTRKKAWALSPRR